MSRAPLRAFDAATRWIFAALAVLAMALPAHAQTTSGNSANGAAIWSANCNGCHGANAGSLPAARNTAKAGGIVRYAIVTGGMMAALPNDPGDYNDVAEYVATFITNPNPTNVAVPFQGSSGAVAANEVYYAGFGALNSLVSALPAPTKGTISINSAARTITYTANACQTGTDTIRYRGSGSGGTTDIRSFTVNIAGPTTGPTLTSSNAVNGQTGVPLTYTTTYTPNCPSLTSFSATNLPPGLSISAAGVVSGTPTAVGVYAASINMTQNGHTTNAPVTFTITLGPPVITSSGTANGAVGFAFNYQITATNPPHISYGATGLPPGLTVDTTTGAITGTPTASGVFVGSVSATNTTNTGSKPVTFNIAVGIPAITSPNTANGQTGQPFSYQITATNGPTSYSASGLPAGLTIDTTTGLISGTPTTVASTGVTITATNGTGTSAPFNLTINVTLGPPVITSPGTANGAAGTPFSYQITATQNPTSFNATGLPTGLSVNTSTGLISGTPTVGGTFNATISATNATGTGSAPLTINIALFAPVVTSPTTASGQTGVAFTYQITANNAPQSYGATGLPSGLSVNPSTGLISGTPTAVGTFNATVSASNGAGTGSQGVTFTITLGPPVITSPTTANGVQGFAMTYQITATNSPTSFNATGLPPGLTVNTTNGLISGTPTTSGTFNATVSATNATATANQAVTFNIAVGPPVITSASTATAQTGVPFSYQITATNAPTSFNATPLPAGLSVNTSTGLISGSPGVTGTFNITLSATNASGTGTANLTLTIAFGPPVITSATNVSGQIGQAFSYQITATGNPTSFGATALPPGLSLNTSTGVISGTPTTGGSFNVTVSATNASGTATQAIVINIGFIAPAVSNVTVATAFNTPVTINLPATGSFTQLSILSQPTNGRLTGGAGLLTVVYTPNNGYSGPDSFTYSVTGPGGTSNVGTVSITVGGLAPVAAALAMTVQVNSALTLDLRSFITGSGITGIAIATPPAHGTAAVNGTKVTYTPNRDFFGADSFTYIAFGNAGDSQPARVSVTVIGRVDPTRDANVIGVVGTHGATAQRFARAQIGNFQQRLESLHNHAPEPQQTASAAPHRPRPVMVAMNDVTTLGAVVPAATTTPLVSALANSFLSLAASQSLGINAATADPGTNVWLAGNLRFGHRDPVNGSERVRFNTDGVSAGIDRRFGRSVLGVGFGFARDKTEIGQEGSKTESDGTAVAAYGSFQVGPRSFIDALVGYASIDFDSDRFVGSVRDFARSSRKGDQWFASVTAGYEHRLEGLLISPYARLDYATTRLKQATETGVGPNALTYFEQTVPMFQGTLGLRAESQHDTRFGAVRPRARIEFSRDFEGDRAAVISYADEFGTRYSVTPTGVKRNALLLGIGSDFLLGGGLRLGIDYSARRSSHADIDQGIRLQITQALDGKGGIPRWFGTSSMFHDPVGVDAGYVYDDNVTRARMAHDKLADHIFSVNATTRRVFPMGGNTRVVGSLFVGGEELYKYTGLGRFTAGAQAEFQYRPSGQFDAITWGIMGRVAGDYYDIPIRRGHRYSISLTARQSLTDRIEAFAAITGNARYARSAVFDLKDYGAKFNLDYALAGPNGSFYVAGEYRRGDTVSSGRFSLENIDIAEALTPDDAFGPGFFSYRFEAKTWIGTFGYNRPLGPRDAIDISWRRVQSYPLDKPLWNVPGPWRYIDNQYSIIYLMRF